MSQSSASASLFVQASRPVGASCSSDVLFLQLGSPLSTHLPSPISKPSPNTIYGGGAGAGAGAGGGEVATGVKVRLTLSTYPVSLGAQSVTTIFHVPVMLIPGR